MQIILYIWHKKKGQDSGKRTPTLKNVINMTNIQSSSEQASDLFNPSTRHKTEIWKDIPGWEGYYQASNLGRIKSVGRSYVKKNGAKCEVIPRFLKPTLSNNGYYVMGFGGRVYTIHRLIAKTFLVNKKNLPQINHKNCNKTDNRVENLEYVTAKQNIVHGWKNGCFKATQGEKNNLSKLKESDVVEIRRLHFEENLNKKELSERFNISTENIYWILTNRTWKHATQYPCRLKRKGRKVKRCEI